MRGGPVLVLILIASVVAGAFAIIQCLRLKKIERKDSKPLRQLARLMNRREWFEALNVLEKHDHPYLESWRLGLLLLTEGKHELHDVEQAVSIEGNRLMAYLESALKPIGAIITILPMLGFLGTIVGLILSFREWEQVGSNITISALAGGMYQAMITTAAGLIAAIPYFLLYHVLVAWTQRIASNFSAETTQLFQWIKVGMTSGETAEPVKVLQPVS